MNRSRSLDVAHVLRLLRDALELTMARCGCRDVPAVAAATVPAHIGWKPRTIER